MVKDIIVGAHYGLKDWLIQRISAAVMAMLIVSRSRSSPTRIASGSSRKAECRAFAKLAL